MSSHLSALLATVALLITDAEGSTSAADVRSAFDAVVTAARPANTWRLEDFGGWGLDASNVQRTFVAANSTCTVLGTGTGKRLRIAGFSGLSGGIIPPGTSVTVSGASNPANNGTFWVSSFSTSGYIEIMHLSAVAEIGASITVSWIETRADMLNFKFNADGTPSASTFDNKAALTALLTMARSVALDPYSIVIEVGPKVYPISFGNDLKGMSNVIIRGPGPSHGGFYFIPGTVSTQNPHGFYVSQATGEQNSVTHIYQSLFMLSDPAGSAPDFGDLSGSGSGDIIHYYQKVGADGTSTATQFPNRVSGVDPQIYVVDCVISGAPRHNIYMRGRGDCHIYNNVIDRAAIHGVHLYLHDSKVIGNTITASGESAVCCEYGGNNVQFSNNLYYFNGTNAQGRVTSSMTKDEQLRYLSTVQVDFQNVKMINDRLEDTSGPALWLGRIANLVLDIDINSCGSLGPTGSDRLFIYGNLPTTYSGGTDWYGKDGVPAIIGNGLGDFSSITAKILWRTGRPGQFVSRVLDFWPSVSDVLQHDWDINIIPGVSQNAAPTAFGTYSMSGGRPAVDDALWSDYGGTGVNGPQKFVGYYRMNYGNYRQAFQNVSIKVRGLPCDDFHARRQGAAFCDTVNVHDRTVIANTKAPVRYTVTDIAVSGTTTKTVTVTVAEAINAADFQLFDAITISGAANSGNNGRFKITSRTPATKKLVFINNNAVAESGGALATVGGGKALLAKKPVGTVTEYIAEAIGTNGSGDVGSIDYIMPDGTTTLFTLNTTGQKVTTKVNITGVEAVI